MAAQADIGLIGLAVMGQNLAMNMNDHGYTVAVFNRTVEKVDEMLAGPAKARRLLERILLKSFFQQLKHPRRVMFMIKAASPWMR